MQIEGQSDRQGMTKLLVTFFHFANVPKEMVSSIYWSNNYCLELMIQKT
jgi:hypothetical protein